MGQPVEEDKALHRKPPDGWRRDVGNRAVSREIGQYIFFEWGDGVQLRPLPFIPVHSAAATQIRPQRPVPFRLRRQSTLLPF